MTEVTVIGGGLAGSAAAIGLARGGRAVTLVERGRGPADKVCGEFLSHEATAYLRAAGVDVREHGAVPIRRLRLCERDRVVTVELPFVAHSLSRRVLDEVLLQQARAHGCVLRRGTSVRGLERERGAWCVRMADGERLRAASVFLATGKHDLRGEQRPAGRHDDLVAFKMNFELAPRQASQLHEHVELVLFRGGYAGLSSIEGGRANLCLVVRRRRLRALGQRWPELLGAMCCESEHLARRLADATPAWPKPLALSRIPYGYVCRRADGLWRLGDQAVVIPSFSGDGMSLALHSAELATRAFLDGRPPQDYQRRLARDARLQVALATGLSHCLVHRPTQLALGLAGRVWPGLLSSVATRTRIPDLALVRARA